MSVRDLIPWGRDRDHVPASSQRDELGPFFSLHREMNRLFDEALSGFGNRALLAACPHRRA